MLLLGHAVRCCLNSWSKAFTNQRPKAFWGGKKIGEKRVGPHLRQKEQSGRPAEGLVPLFSNSHAVLFRAFLLGPELHREPPSSLSPAISSPLWLTNGSFGDFFPCRPTSELFPCFLARLMFPKHSSVPPLLQHLRWLPTAYG